VLDILGQSGGVIHPGNDNLAAAPFRVQKIESEVKFGNGSGNSVAKNRGMDGLRRAVRVGFCFCRFLVRVGSGCWLKHKNPMAGEVQ